MNAHFASLVVGLAHQADQALAGNLPAGIPGADQPREVARSLIDTLGMLEEKTRGNLAEEESKLLAEALTALRFRFVAGAK
jgi:uncharacterized protein DUF1844